DALRRQLVGQVLGHCRHRDVAHAADRRARPAGGVAADVDDATASPRGHVRRNLAYAAEVAHHFDVDVGPEDRIVDLGQLRRWRLPTGLCGRVDQDVDAPQLL